MLLGSPSYQDGASTKMLARCLSYKKPGSGANCSGFFIVQSIEYKSRYNIWEKQGMKK